MALIGLVADFLGLAGDFISIMQTSASISAGAENANTATIRIGVGLDHDQFSGAGGDLPDARNFGITGNYLGMVADPGNKVDDGEAESFTVGQSNAQQAVYTVFSANDDAICIAYAYMIWPGEDTSSQYAFDGSWGKLCGATWYLSQVVVPGTNYMPNCMWIDANGDQPTTGFQVNWVDMQGQEATNGTDASRMCDTPSFKLYTNKDPNTVNYWTSTDPLTTRSPHDFATGAVDAPRSKHQSRLQTRGGVADKFSDTLVVSDHDDHSAQMLCNSTTSAGPDFVNPNHAWFCDMTNKALYPVCNNGTVTRGNSTSAKGFGTIPCFDLKSKTLNGPGVRKRSSPYNVQDWRESQEPKLVAPNIV